MNKISSLFILLVCIATANIQATWDWTHPGKLVPTDIIKNASFGGNLLFQDSSNLAISGVGDDGFKGAVWITHWTGRGTIDLIYKLKPIGNSTTSLFGSSLAFSSDNSQLAIGGPDYYNGQGAVWTYSKDYYDKWAYLEGLTSNSTYKSFGSSIAFFNNDYKLAIGAPTAYSNQGCIILYSQSVDGTWINPSIIIPGNNIGQSYFGSTLAFSPDTQNSVIGGWNDNSGKGAVWLYDTSSGSFQNPQKLVPTDIIGSAKFGEIVKFAYNSKYLAISGENDNSGMGAVWVYSKYANGTWDLNNPRKLVPAYSIGAPSFGKSIEFSEDNVNLVIGGPNDNTGDGAAWIYSNTYDHDQDS